MMESAFPTAASRRDLWSIRLFYFIFVGGSAFLMPFLGLFYRQRGLSGTEIGLLATVGSIFALSSAPVWGRWSDRSTHPRRLLQTALLLATLGILWLSQQRFFTWMLVVTSLRSLVGAGIEPLTDRMALRLLRRSGSTDFGSVRLWGSLGWALVAMAAGWMIERSGALLTGFLGAAFFQVICVLLLNLMNTNRLPEEVTSEPGQGSTWSLAGSLLKDRRMIGLAGTLVIFWFVLGGLYQFQAIYLDQLGAGESLIGLAWTFSATVEIPGMWWADRLVRRLGAARVLELALVFEALRTLPVLIWPSVPAIIISGLFTGIAYSLLTVGVVMFINTYTAKGQMAITLALYTITLPGLVQIVGGPLTGLVFDALGAYALYGITLAGSLLAWLVLHLTTRPVNPKAQLEYKI